MSINVRRNIKTDDATVMLALKTCRRLVARQLNYLDSLSSSYQNKALMEELNLEWALFNAEISRRCVWRCGYGRGPVEVVFDVEVQ
jgi:hypothetical protein